MSEREDQTTTGSLMAQSLPKGVTFSDPLSTRIYFWLNDVAKAIKGLKVYAENNETLQKYLSQAFFGLEDLLTEQTELTLAVREDRFLYGKDAVHTNADREEGLPFIFYRNAFRRLTFVQGMTSEEFHSLLRAITEDYSSFDYAGEDLVTALWRLSLPHLRYLTIDAITVEAKGAKDSDEREEIDRIQGDIESIVATIYNSVTASTEDIVAGVTITKEDLEAFKEIRDEAEDDLDLLDHATARAITNVAARELAALRHELESEDKDELTRRTMDVLIKVLFLETTSKDAKGTLDALQQLFDALVLGQRFAHATELVRKLQVMATDAEVMQEMHMARHLLRLFSSESRVQPVLNTLGEGYKTATIGEVTDFLRALGPDITPHLLRALDTLSNPAHRRLVCDLIVEFGVPDVRELMSAAKDSKWFVVRDILGLAQRLPDGSAAPLIANAIQHEHSKVRATAVGMLRSFGRGTADRLLAERIEQDDDLEVRLSAVRVAAARGTVEAKPALERLLQAEFLSSREDREVRMLTAAYAKIAGPEAIPVLDKILNAGFFASLRSGEAQVAAAYALGAIGTEAAMATLGRATRSLSGRVREAAKKALGKVDGQEASDETSPKTTEAASTQKSKIPNFATEPEARPDLSRTMLSIPDVKTELGREESKDDPLAAAPAFAPSMPGESKTETVDLHRSGPAVPRVQTPHRAPERIPSKLPNLPPPEVLPSNLPTGRAPGAEPKPRTERPTMRLPNVSVPSPPAHARTEELPAVRLPPVPSEPETESLDETEEDSQTVITDDLVLD